MFDTLRISLCPPLRELLVLQTRGKMRRSWQRLKSPRRAIPTLLVGVLFVLYVIQIYIALSYRGPQTSVQLESYAPLAFVGILWLKLMGVCIDRKKTGAGFRSEETHQLIGGPFSREQVRLYRVSGHAISILFTSLFAAVFFRFHVKSYAAAFCGSYLAMMFTYLVYTLIAIAAVQVSETTYKRTRNTCCCLFVAVMAVCFSRAVRLDAGAIEFLRAIGEQALWVSQWQLSQVVLAPYNVFTKIVLAETIPAYAWWMVPGLLINYLALCVLLRGESYLVQRCHRREKLEFLHADGVASRERMDPKQLRTRVEALARPLPHLWGAGAMLWRQWKATLRLSAGLFWLLGPLAVISALAGYVISNPDRGTMDIILAIVVLTSVFLPGLLTFDFRGDLRGLSALKMLPAASLSIVLGQLAMPVILLTAFQTLALSGVVCRDPSALPVVFKTICFLVPTNLIIVGLENLVFLLYPYRISDFDMQATVRRIVMLMTKFCVLFVSALVLAFAGLGVLGLRMAVSSIPWLAATMSAAETEVMFAAQLIGMLAIAAMVVKADCWAFRRFDPSLDVPL